MKLSTWHRAKCTTHCDPSAPSLYAAWYHDVKSPVAVDGCGSHGFCWTEYHICWKQQDRRGLSFDSNKSFRTIHPLCHAKSNEALSMVDRKLCCSVNRGVPANFLRERESHSVSRSSSVMFVGNGFVKHCQIGTWHEVSLR